jgi:E3 ubiquitin-protein ligase HERC3
MSLFAWGFNGSGQIVRLIDTNQRRLALTGYCVKNPDPLTFSHDPEAMPAIIKVACGDSHTVALTGTVLSVICFESCTALHCWAAYCSQQLLARLQIFSAQQQRRNTISRTTSLTTHTNTCTEHGDVLSCGRGREGQLGNGQRDNSAELQPPQGLTHCTVVDIAAGSFHTAAVTASGLVYQWGLVSDAPREKRSDLTSDDADAARGVLPGMQGFYGPNSVRERIAAASAEKVRHSC